MIVQKVCNNERERNVPRSGNNIQFYFVWKKKVAMKSMALFLVSEPMWDVGVRRVLQYSNECRRKHTSKDIVN